MSARMHSQWVTVLGGLALWIVGNSTQADDAIAEASTAPSSVSLSYKFQPGQFVHYEVSKRIRYVTRQGENSFEGVQQSDETKHFRVVSIDEEGHALLEPIIDHVKMSARFDVQPPVVFDSSTDTVVPEEFKGIKETIGRPLARFQVSASGALLKVFPIDPNAAKAMAADSTNSKGRDQTIAKDDRNVDATDAKRPDPKLNFLIAVPVEPVQIGHKWKEKYETGITVGKGLTQQMPMQRQFELTAVTNGIATIKFRTTTLAPANDPEVMRQLVQQMPSGIVEFDIAQGLIRSQRSVMNESVVNAFGPQTLLQVVGESSEKLLPAESATKSAPDEPTIQQAGFTKEDGATDK